MIGQASLRRSYRSRMRKELGGDGLARQKASVVTRLCAGRALQVTPDLGRNETQLRREHAPHASSPHAPPRDTSMSIPGDGGSMTVNHIVQALHDLKSVLSQGAR